MSISSMSNAAVARRSDFQPAGKIPKDLEEIAKAASATPGEVEVRSSIIAEAAKPSARPTDNAEPAQKSAGDVTNAIQVIAAYIPTEILTLYVAVLAALHQPGQITYTGWSVFYSFLIATPIVVWLVFAAKLKGSGKSLPLKFGQWPVWEMVAATLAYVAWAFTLPNNPFTSLPWYSSGMAGIAVLIVSTLLGLLAPIFQHSIDS